MTQKQQERLSLEEAKNGEFAVLVYYKSEPHVVHFVADVDFYDDLGESSTITIDVLEEEAMFMSYASAVQVMDMIGSKGGDITMYTIARSLLETPYSPEAYDVEASDGTYIVEHDICLIESTQELVIVQTGRNVRTRKEGLVAVNDVLGLRDWLDVYPNGELTRIGNLLQGNHPEDELEER